MGHVSDLLVFHFLSQDVRFGNLTIARGDGLLVEREHAVILVELLRLLIWVYFAHDVAWNELVGNAEEK